MYIPGEERPSFLSALLTYGDRDVLPLHTPGHKQGRGSSELFREAWQERGLELDIDPPVLEGTEGPVLPTKLLQRAKDKAARLFGASKTHFLTNGTSAGILAMFLAVAHHGKIIIPRQVHQSVIQALILCGAQPQVLPPAGTSSAIPDSRLDLAKVREALEKDSEIRGVFIQNPSYYGFAADLSQLANLCHEHKIPLLVDEAHGPHFTFSDQLPPDALSQGADLVAQSTHKMLTSLTGSSMLHVAGLGHNLGIDRFVNLVQSSSPSFLLLASLEAAVYQWESQGREIIQETLELVADLRSRLVDLSGVQIFGKAQAQALGYPFWDPTKVVLDFSELGLSGLQAADLLRRDYLIQVEMADFQRILAVFGPGDDVSSSSRLELALRDLVQKGPWKNPISEVPLPHSGGPMELSPADAFYAPSRKIPLADSAGKVSSAIIAPYPPGIPIILPGEVITDEQIEYLQRLFELGQQAGINTGETQEIEIIQ